AAIAAAPAAKDVTRTGGGTAVALGLETEQRYLDGAQALSLSRAGARDLCIVHTALHGVGTKLARQLLGRAGFSKVISVAAQAEPDGEF
ncbi:phospho-sugar mutase, partial [Streptococcus suis]